MPLSRDLLILFTALPLIHSANLFAQNGWRMHGFSGQRTYSSTAVGPATLPQFNVLLPNYVTSIKAIGDDGSLYLNDLYGFACYSATGQLKWRPAHLPSEAGDVAVAPLSSGGAVYIVVGQDNSNLLVALDPNTGNQLWRFPLSAAGNNPMAIDSQGVIYITDGRNPKQTLRAINSNGALQWEVVLPGYYDSLSGYQTFPVLSNDESVVYIESEQSSTQFVAALSADSGASLTIGQYSGGFLAFIAPWGTVYFAPGWLGGIGFEGCSSQIATCTQIGTGVVFRLETMMAGEVIASNTNSSASVFYDQAFDQNNSLLWTSSEPLSVAISDAAGTLYAWAYSTSQLVALNGTGTELWRQGFPGGLDQLLLGGNGSLYVLSSDALYASLPVLPLLLASPPSLGFSYQLGTVGPPEPQNLTISTSTTAALSFTASASTIPAGGTWLSVSPTTGTTGAASGTVSVSINPQGLTVGAYNGQITIIASGASNSPLNVAVTLTVTLPPNTGTITVSTNLAKATFTITGSATYSGSGRSATFPGVPTGKYTIGFGAVAGYITPVTQTKVLVDGSTITFTGLYNQEFTIPYTSGASAEPSIACDPSTTNHAVVAFNAVGNGVLLYETYDAGQSWVAVTVPFPEYFHTVSDPWLRYGPSGELIFSVIANNSHGITNATHTGVFAAVSPTGKAAGFNEATAIKLVPCQGGNCETKEFPDHPSIAVIRGTSGGDRIVACWADAFNNAANVNIYTAYSDDQGGTWSSPAFQLAGPTSYVCTTGGTTTEVGIVWFDRSTGQLMAATSLDGATWNTPTNPETTLAPVGQLVENGWMVTAVATSEPYGVILPDGEGGILAVAQVRINNKPQVLVATPPKAGEGTWTTKPLGDPNQVKFIPGAGTCGGLASAYGQQPNSGGALRYQVWKVSQTNPIFTSTQDMYAQNGISNSPWPPFIGDYSSLDCSSQRVGWAAWTDTRSGRAAIYISRFLIP